MGKVVKINDLGSDMWARFEKKEFVPETSFAVGWRRVSTKKQRKKGHFSSEVQQENIDEYIRDEGLDVLACWDVAETASKPEKRKKFDEMLEYVKASQKTDRPIKHLVFSYTSRSSRNRYSRRELEALVDLGIVIHFARDGLKITCQSDLVEYMNWLLKAFKDEEDIAVHKENVWEGMLTRVEMGLFPGRAPFGYRNYRPREDDLSIFILDPGPADFMRDAFDKFATGMYSMEELVDSLHADQKHKHLSRKPNAKRLGELLRNPFFYGDFIFMGKLCKGNPEYHPRLISFELWTKVQKVLDKRLRGTVKEGEHPYLGMMRCGGFILDENGKETTEPCGCAVTAEEKRKKLADGSISYHYYYHCNSTRPCSQRDKGYLQSVGKERVNYTLAEIELLFEQVFKPLHFTDEVCKWMQDVLMQEHREKSQDHKQQVAALRRRYEMLQSYIDHAYEDKVRGVITEELWREKNSKWRLERDQIGSEIASLDGKKDDYIDKGVLLIELAQRTESIYKNATPDVKRKMVLLLSSNHVLRNGNIRFDWEKPFDLLAKAHPKEKWWS